MNDNYPVIDPKTGKLKSARLLERENIMAAGGPNAEQLVQWRREDKEFERDFNLGLYLSEGMQAGNYHHGLIAQRRLQQAEAEARAEDIKRDKLAEKIAEKLRGR